MLKTELTALLQVELMRTKSWDYDEGSKLYNLFNALLIEYYIAIYNLFELEENKLTHEQQVDLKNSGFALIGDFTGNLEEIYKNKDYIGGKLYNSLSENIVEIRNFSNNSNLKGRDLMDFNIKINNAYLENLRSL